MKKIFTLLAMAFSMAIAATAQELVFKYQGAIVESGATLTFHSHYDSVWEYTICSTGIGNDALVVENTTGDDMTVSATLTVIDDALLKANPQSSHQWCLGGVCEPVEGNSLTKSNIKIGAREAKPLQYDLYDYNGFTTYGEMLSNISISYGAGKTINVNVKFVHADPAGIQATENTRVTEVTRYTIDGQRVSGPVKGLNIIKLSNGKTIKQVIN